MRGRWAVIAGLGIVLTSAGAWAQETTNAPQLRVLSERSDRPAPTILRGPYAAPPAAAAAEAAPALLVVAGKRLWLVDQANGEVLSCINRDTSTVGRREIRCTAAELGRYGRTFGANFRP